MKIITGEEGLVVWEAYQSKNPKLPYKSYDRFDIQIMDMAECIAKFRVCKHDISVLANVLQLPVNIDCQQRTVCDKI